MRDERFRLPGPGATDAERRVALDRMNGVKLTVYQFERGWAEYEAAYVRAYQLKLPIEAPMAALEDFCAGEGLFPSDVAAGAIFTRAQPIFLAGGDDVDLKSEHPDIYQSYILDPIEPEDVGIGI